jgi:hypothetical protein
MNRLKNLVRLIFVSLLLISVLYVNSSAQTYPKNVQVVVKKGVDKDYNRLIEQNASVILTQINQQSPQVFDLPQSIKDDEGSYGLKELKELLINTGIKVSKDIFETDILIQRDNLFEIRGIEVEIDSSKNEGRTDNDRELVLIFNKFGQLLSVRFALEKTRYQKVMRYSVDLKDELRRKQILAYVEQFRTAYNRKDLEYIEQQFSDKALIITGVKLQTGKNDVRQAKKSEIGEENYEYLTQTKKEYLQRLKNIFSANSFIDIKFEGVKINQHPDYPEVYGVNLYQVWNSQRYNDTGYLFLMIDYEDENRPEIYVRAWHEKPIMVRGSGTVIDMSMFDLVK